MTLSFCCRALANSFQREVDGLIRKVRLDARTKGLPFEVGRKVDIYGDCLYDSVLAQVEDLAEVEDPVIKATIPVQFRGITTPKGCYINLILMKWY